MWCGLGPLGIVFGSDGVGLQLRVYKSMDSDSWLLRSYTVFCSHSASSQRCRALPDFEALVDLQPLVPVTALLWKQKKPSLQ
jgi:hypothetical protein